MKQEIKKDNFEHYSFKQILASCSGTDGLKRQLMI